METQQQFDGKNLRRQRNPNFVPRCYMHARWDECIKDGQMPFTRDEKYSREQVFGAGFCAYLKHNKFRCAKTLDKGERQMCTHHYQKWIDHRAKVQRDRVSQQVGVGPSALAATNVAHPDSWNSSVTITNRDASTGLMCQQQVPANVVISDLRCQLAALRQLCLQQQQYINDFQTTMTESNALVYAQSPQEDTEFETDEGPR